MTPYLRDLLDQLPSDSMRMAFEGVEDDMAIEILECYHFTAGVDEREACEEFFESGGPALINELLEFYKDGTPTTKDLQDIWRLSDPE